ncbi:MAG: hypothetical protein J7K98_01290 [Candidatus Aenigmarchaeota archaeon]|nr:hypothetical protein [Candidatus Aenigmarchaeota archaeon]
MKKTNIGELAFLAGVVIAVIAGIPGLIPSVYETWVTSVLLLLGFLVGLLNITEKEVVEFLVASITLLVASSPVASTMPQHLSWIGTILTYISVFVAPAAVIVALKAVYELGMKK